MEERMGDLLKNIVDAGVAGFVISGLGFFALALIFERGKALFFDMKIDTKKFFEQVQALVRNDKIEDAIKLCSGNKKAPVTHVVKKVLEKADRDREQIREAADISVAEVVPKLTQRLGYLAMISNVATLIGLLGTIQGLIMSFNAVSFADPAQKQTLLAQGISMAMNTTALGLTVAIPVMIIYAFLHARQSSHFEEINEYTNKVVDLLNSRDYVPYSEGGAYPEDHRKDAAPDKSSQPKPPPFKKPA
jgi:biopolymer transport protein ExbB/TolQ